MKITVKDESGRNRGQIKVWLQWSLKSRGITPDDVIVKKIRMQVNKRLLRVRELIEV